LFKNAKRNPDAAIERMARILQTADQNGFSSMDVSTINFLFNFLFDMSAVLIPDIKYKTFLTNVMFFSGLGVSALLSKNISFWDTFSSISCRLELLLIFAPTQQPAVVGI
jgi:hypothetical protein